ncbi:hypothetical protein [Legionella quinlivanii]|uniref:hypothetical protein n=1 Tax=Legionella quinlivanii TaxID=45073 RepID=UPI00209C1BEA|nr:hypothetical protein [Legionella quinlivanii]
MVKFFDSFTVTTAAAAGIPTASASGPGFGFSQAVTASQNAATVLSDKSGRRDSLLHALNVLFEDPADIDHSVLDSYMKELREGLIATNDSLAFITRYISLAMVSGVSHLAQIPSDGVTVTHKTAEGLSRLDIPSDEMKNASTKAFIFNPQDQKPSASIDSVAGLVKDQGGQVMDNVYNAINIAENSHAGTHARTAASTGAGGSVTATAFIPSAAALLTNMVGQLFREGSAVSHFLGQESASEADDKNVYHASSGVKKATQDSDSQASQRQLKILEKALSHMQAAADLSSNQSVSTPLATALFRVAALSLFSVASRLVNKTAIAATEGRVQKALAQATEQGPSGGVDRINSLHSNLFSLSNIMRLCAENLGGSSAVKTAAQVSETIAGRSMSVLLSHISELAQALRGLAKPQQNSAGGYDSGTIDSSVDLANPEVLAQFEKAIKGVLDGIEEANGQHIIPNLNQDMASQLDVSAHGTVASLVTTHSLFNSVTVSAKASRKAVKTNEAQQNEALLSTLPSITVTLNNIQAFTRNFMAEIEKDIAPSKSRNGSLLSTHDTVGSSTAAAYWAASAMVLLIDEMLSACRSLTLIDQNRLNAASEKASEVQSRKHSNQASQQISWDSHSEQEYSATHAITALRLTLSHTGLALIRIATDLNKALKDNLDTVQHNLAMHTLQQSVLHSLAYTTASLAEGSLLASGATSAAPMSMHGSVNWTHQKVHTTDGHLHPAQTHESENCSRGDCQSSQATGFSTDLVAGTITNVMKVLAQGGLIGLDTMLRLIKLLEIVSLHRDSHIALKLESTDSSNPNGLLINTVDEPSVGSSAGTSAILINLLGAFQTLDQSSGTQSTLNAQRKLQKIIDSEIADIAVLKDDEERGERKGLKEFYKIIIGLLAPNASAANCESLVQRLDFGGISLSSYHTRFGAYSDRPAADLSFVDRFANQDDAQGILRRFVNKAKTDFNLFKSLHEQLPQAQRTTKAQILYTHVFEELYQNYKQMKMLKLAEHSSRKIVPGRDEFESDLGLVHAQPEEEHQTEAPGLQN